jgi:hypothetical protein
MAESQWVTIYAICDECKLSAEVRVRDGGAENIFPENTPIFGRHPPVYRVPKSQGSFPRRRVHSLSNSRATNDLKRDRLPSALR